MMWQHNYYPIGNLYVSALLAAVPIIFFLAALTLFKLKGTTAAALTLVLSIGMAALLFGMPMSKILATALFGVLSGLWPIGYIVLMAVWLYKLAVKSGKFDVIRGSIASISEDQRVQVILIAFCFSAFLEGAAGFGVPIAICAALLVELGFKPLKAAMLCLVANAASGAYGAIGIPVLVGALQGDVPLSAMSIMLILIVQSATLFIPALVVFLLDGWRGFRETWPVVVGIGVLFSAVQALTLYVLGPELVDIIAPLIAMGALAAFMTQWQPRRVYREPGAPAGPTARWPLPAVLRAWSPFYILTFTILAWSLPAFKALFAPGGWLAMTVLRFPMPGLHAQVLEVPPVVTAPHALPAVWTVALISASGTAILISALLTTASSKRLTAGIAWQQLALAWRELWRPIAMIAMIMAVAYIANFAGASSVIGLALAQTGEIFPLISPVIGWMGVFITGSVVNSNTLFAHLQAVTATQIGTSSALLVAASTAGGVMAKLVSPQSIAIAAAAVGMVGKESDIMRSALRYSLALLAYVCLAALLIAHALR